MKKMSVGQKAGVFMVVLILVQLFIVPALVFAEGTGTALGFEDSLDNLYAAVTGRAARLIGMLMMVGAGLMIAFTEGQAVKRLLWIVAGVGLALNASAVFEFITGEGFLL